MCGMHFPSPELRFGNAFGYFSSVGFSPGGLKPTLLGARVACFQRQVVLLAISPLMADDLLHQIDALARRHGRFVLARFIFAVRRTEPPAENHLARHLPASFQLSPLGR